jgi:hypothetical protein
MATVIEPRPLADLEQSALVRVEEEWQQRAHGIRPWTTQEYLDRIARVHAHYAVRREWLRQHPQGVA